MPTIEERVDDLESQVGVLADLIKTMATKTGVASSVLVVSDKIDATQSELDGVSAKVALHTSQINGLLIP